MHALRCPNCQSPLDDEAVVCPYCHTASLRGGASFGSPLVGYILGGVILLVVGGLFLYDYYNGTRMLPAVWSFFGDGE